MSNEIRAGLPVHPVPRHAYWSRGFKLAASFAALSVAAELTIGAKAIYEYHERGVYQELSRQALSTYRPDSVRITAIKSAGTEPLLNGTTDTAAAVDIVIAATTRPGIPNEQSDRSPFYGMSPASGVEPVIELNGKPTGTNTHATDPMIYWIDQPDTPHGAARMLVNLSLLAGTKESILDYPVFLPAVIVTGSELYIGRHQAAAQYYADTVTITGHDHHVDSVGLKFDPSIPAVALQQVPADQSLLSFG